MPKQHNEETMPNQHNQEELIKQSYVTMSEACFLTRQDRHEIHSWIMRGDIKAYKTTNSDKGHWKINTKSLLKYLDKMEFRSKTSNSTNRKWRCIG